MVHLITVCMRSWNIGIPVVPFLTRHCSWPQCRSDDVMIAPPFYQHCCQSGRGGGCLLQSLLLWVSTCTWFLFPLKRAVHSNLMCYSVVPTPVSTASMYMYSLTHPHTHMHTPPPPTHLYPFLPHTHPYPLPPPPPPPPHAHRQETIIRMRWLPSRK